MSDAASPWKTYQRLIGFSRPYRGLLLVALAGMVIEAAAGGYFTKLMEPIVNETFIARDKRASIVLPLTIVGLFLVRGIAGYVADTSMARAGRSVAGALGGGVVGN